MSLSSASSGRAPSSASRRDNPRMTGAQPANQLGGFRENWADARYWVRPLGGAQLCAEKVSCARRLGGRAHALLEDRELHARILT